MTFADQLLAIWKRTVTEPDFDTSKAVQSLLDDARQVDNMASQIKITNKPAPPQRLDPNKALRANTFTAWGQGTRPSDGQKYTVYRLEDAMIVARPHKDGTALTDDEIAATIAQWNREAEVITKSARNG